MEVVSIAMIDTYQLAGLLGVFAYILNYAALSLRWISSECTLYFLGNIAAAFLVLISLTSEFNLASFF